MELINNNQVPEGYKKTEVGVIPEDWEVLAIGETVTLINGRAFKPSDWTTHGLPIIRIQNLNDPEAIYNYYEGTVEERYYVNDGDILFAWSGSKESSFGARMWHGQRAILNQHIFKVIPDNKKITYKYILLALKRFQEDIERKSHGFKTSFVHVRKSDLENTCLAIPPLPEQKAIAQTLSDVDALIAALDKLIAKKRNIKTATMQQLLTGKTRLPGFGEGKGYKKTEVGVIPENWEVKQIYQLTEVDPENLTSKTHPDYEFNYISLEDVDNGFLCSYSNQVFSKSPSRARRILRYQDILFATVRPNLKSHLFFDKDQSDWICSTGFSVLRCKENQLLPNFLFSYLFSGAISTQIEALISGSNYPAINSNDVKNLEILLPPIPEQQAIAQVLSDIDSEITALEKRRAKTQAIKQGMMQELLTGKTRLINN